MSHNSRRHGHAVTPNDYEITRTSYVPEFKNPEKFIEAKINMLQNDFRIDLSLDDIVHLKSLKTERAINAAVRAIIDRAWR